MKIFIRNNRIIAGMTLKDETKLEANNMALHSCENKTNIIQNRRNLATQLGTTLDSFVCPTQTHSANFYEVTTTDIGRGAYELEDAIHDTDALYTYEKDIVLCSFSADCVPVLFYHETENVIGAIHSGWRGTVQEITRKLFTHLIEEKQCAADGFRIIIGPAICQKNFEVDEDVAALFRVLGYAGPFIHYNTEKEKYFIDNQKTIARQCELVGITPNQIMIDHTCTFDAQDGFSHRRDKQAGRHMAFIRRMA